MVDELKKIELITTDELQTQSTMTEQIRPIKKKNHFPLVFGCLSVIILILGVVGLGAFIGWTSFKTIIADSRVLVGSAKALGSAIKKQDLGNTKTELANTRQKLDIVAKDFTKVKPYESLPYIGSFVSDGSHLIKAAYAGLDAGDKAIEALEPNADLLGLKGKSTFVSGTADDRIQMAVKTMGALTPKINDMAKSIDTLQKEIDAIDAAKYPEKIGSTQVRSRIVAIQELIDNSASLFVNAQPLLMSLPSMLGEPSDKRYLVLFQNDKELRSTGGFLTAYAQFRFVRGKAILEKADNIYSLDDALKQKFPATREILTFHKNVYQLYIRDSNLSPDFRQSMLQFERMYNTSSGAEKIDGIFAVDTHVLVEALKILGPSTIYGRVFSADNDPRCDCPRAVYELEDYSSRPVGYVRSETERKDIIGVLLRDILQKALGVSPSKYWGSLFQMLLTEIQKKHVLAYLHDPQAQKGVESFNMAGRIMSASESAAILKYQENKGWDYVHVNNSNMAGAKSNMFVSDAMTKDISVSGDTVTTKLTVEYKNPYPGSDCNLERGGLCLNAPLRNWVRVYVPLGSKLIESKGTQSPQDGRAKPMETYDSLGKTVFEGFIIVNPLGTARLDLTYTTPIHSTDGKYHLLWQKQPGTENTKLTLKKDGKEVKKTPLEGDMEFTL